MLLTRSRWIWLGLVLILIKPLKLEAQTYFTDGDDLQQAVNAGSPGDIFIVSNGTYNDFEGSFTAHGTEAQPIHIKAETIGGVSLTGESHFTFKKAAHIILEGFVFDGQDENTLVKLEGSHHIRLTRNIFELETIEPIKWVFIGGVWNDHTFQFPSHHNRVDHNIFRNKNTPGHYITIDGTSNADDSDIRQSQYDRIDHNYFVNNGPRAANEQESIRIGWSEMSQSSGYTLVEHNLFEDCDGDPEIISVKSCDNTIRYNTFRGSYGTLSLRHGNRNRVEGNYFFGNDKPNGIFVNDDGDTSTIHTGGIRIYGTDHVIVNNYMEGLKGTRWDAPIALTQGDAIDGSSSNLSKHFRAERVTIAYNTLVNNTYGIEIGFDNNGKYNKGLKDIVITNNIIQGEENSLIRYVDGHDQGSEISWYNNVFYPTGSANLTSDGSSFSTQEAQVINPELSFGGGLWKATSQTPSMPLGWTGLSLDRDIEYQLRPATSQVGADHLGQDPVWNPPLHPDDVGPNGADFTTSLDAAFFPEIRIYPNPATDFIFVEAEESKPESLHVLTLSGKVLWSREMRTGESAIKVDLPNLPSGLYLLVLQRAGKQQGMKLSIARE